LPWQDPDKGFGPIVGLTYKQSNIIRSHVSWKRTYFDLRIENQETFVQCLRRTYPRVLIFIITRCKWGVAIVWSWKPFLDFKHFYMDILLKYHFPIGGNKVWNYRKAYYGLKQCPWRFTEAMMSLGYNSKCDHIFIAHF
jgi:hypothetical protein